MGADDLVRQSKAEAGAFAGLFGGEERLEDVLHRLLVHAAAGVGDTEANVVGPLFRDLFFREEGLKLPAGHDAAPDGQRSALRADGVDGVDADVQQHLLQLGRIAQHTLSGQRVLFAQLHVLRAVGLHQLPGPMEQSLHRHGVVDRLHVLPAHGGDLLHDLLRLLGRLADLHRVVVDLAARVGVGHDEVGIAGDGGEEVIELMGDAAGKGAHHLQPLPMGQRFLAAVQLFEGLVQGLQVADLGGAPAVALLQTEHLEHEEHQHQCHAAKDEHHLHEALLYRLVEVVIIHHGADDPEAVPHLQMAEGAYFMHPGQARVGPPVGIVIQRTGFLLLLGAQQLAQAAQVQRPVLIIDALAALHDLDAPLDGLGVHDHKIVVVLYHDVTVGADVDLRDELLIHDRRVHHEADGLLPRLFFHHKIVFIPAVVLPVGDLICPGDKDITDRAESIAAVDDLAVAVFQPDVPDGVAPGHGGAETCIRRHLFGDGVQSVSVFLQQDADAVGGALHHQLHLPRLAGHQGGAVVLPHRPHHKGQRGHRHDADGQRHPQGAQGLEPCLFRGSFLLHFISSFGAVLLFLSKNVIILFM